MNPELIISLLAAAVVSGTPILFATLGEMFTEKSGVLNLGVEGVMLVGCLTGFLVAKTTGKPVPGLFRRRPGRNPGGLAPRCGLLNLPGQSGGVRPGADPARDRAGQLPGKRLCRSGGAGIQPRARAAALGNSDLWADIVQPRSSGLLQLHSAAAVLAFFSSHPSGAASARGRRVSRRRRCRRAQRRGLPLGRGADRRLFHGIGRGLSVAGLHPSLDQQSHPPAGAGLRSPW